GAAVGGPDRLRAESARAADADLPDRDAVAHAAAEADRLELADPHPADAGPVRLLLCLPPLHHLPRGRSELPLAGDLGRPDEAEVHLRRLHRVRAALAAGAHFDQRGGAPPGCRALAAAAPPGLPDRYAGRHPFRLAGEKGPLRAAD